MLFRSRAAQALTSLKILQREEKRLENGYRNFCKRVITAEPRTRRLTERFYRVDRGRSRETGGTGLGLAIVKHILTRHQAKLEIIRELGAGSTFSAIFPKSRLVMADSNKQ